MSCADFRRRWGRMVLAASFVSAVCVSTGPASADEGSEPSAEPVTAPTVVVQGTRTYPEGTGTLHLSEQSQGKLATWGSRFARFRPVSMW
jgi:hypothetical protein